MFDSKEIMRRQNEEKMLDIQASAHLNFNRADYWNLASILLCFISIFLIFIPSTLSSYLLYGIPCLHQSLILFCSYCSKKAQKNAAFLRNFFDDYVLETSNQPYSTVDLKSAKEMAHKDSKNAKVKDLKTHTGSTTPPGIKDWYVFKHDYDEIQAQIECQKQNVWWDKKFKNKRFLATFAFIAFLFIFYFYVYKFKDPFFIFFNTIALLEKSYELIKDAIQYNSLSFEIDGQLKCIENDPTEKNLQVLKENIQKRRFINTIGWNSIHKILANHFTEVCSYMNE